MVKSTDPVLFSTRLVKDFSKPTAEMCESYGCNNKSVTRILVGVGILGNIDLNVCKRCIPKFSDNIRSSTKNGTAHHSLSLDDKKVDSNEYILSTS